MLLLQRDFTKEMYFNVLFIWANLLNGQQMDDVPFFSFVNKLSDKASGILTSVTHLTLFQRQFLWLPNKASVASQTSWDSF